MIMKKKNKPDQKRYLGYLLLCLWMIWTAGLSVRAAEEKNAVFGTLQALSADAEVKQEAREDSASVASLPAGTPVIVMGQEGTWSRILCQGTEGYIPTDTLGPYIAEAGSLDAEMEDAAEAEARTVEEYELYKREKRSLTVWEIVIAVLILAFFGTGMVSAIWKMQEEEAKGKGTKKKRTASGRQRRRRKKGTGNKKQTEKQE